MEALKRLTRGTPNESLGEILSDVMDSEWTDLNHESSNVAEALREDQEAVDEFIFEYLDSQPSKESKSSMFLEHLFKNAPNTRFMLAAAFVFGIKVGKQHALGSLFGGG